MTFHDGIKASNSGPWLPSRQAAEYTGLSIWTLKRMRAAGEGPNWSRVRRRAIYDVHELNRWMSSQATHQSHTSRTETGRAQVCAILDRRGRR